MMVRVLSVLLVAGVAMLAAACGGAAPPSAPGGGATLSGLPLTFVENRGQSDARVRFHAQGRGHAFLLARDRIALTLVEESGRGVNLGLRFLGADPDVTVIGRERAPGAVNFLRGADPARWRTRVPSFQEVVYRELWPGVDLALRGREGELKYEFRVRPGARPQDIRLAYRGAEDLRRDGAGALLIGTALGVLRDSPPVAYQEIAGARVPVDSRYLLDGDRAYGFAVGQYHPDRELIIDPGLAYSTFLGGSSHEEVEGIAVDAAGNAYVAGFTQSPNFPTTSGAFDRTGSTGNDLDAFIAKLNPTGTALVYSTFLGGGNFEWGRDIAVDSAGNAYVAGQTKSSSFPTTGGAFDRSFNVANCPRCGIDQYDAFVTKLNATGSGLVYSTFLGGTDIDDALGIAVNAAGNAFVTGQTTSSGFPATSGAFDTSPGGAFDAFVTKLNATGSALVYSTRLGGVDNELPEDVAVDGAGNAYVGGSTRSADFPTTAGAFDRTRDGVAFDELFDFFVTKLNAGGSGLVYSTFLGGSEMDTAGDFAIDAAGNAYLAGGTLSPDFPTTAGVFDGVFDGPSESLVAKLDATGSTLVYSTFLGEGGASAIVPDRDGNAWLAGTATAAAFTTPDALRGFGGGPNDAYVAKLNATGSGLDFATFLGGSSPDGSGDIALGPGGDVYAAGHTYSADFPTTLDAVDRAFAGDSTIFWGEAWVARITLGTDTPTPTPTPSPTATSTPNPTPTPTATPTPTPSLPAPSLLSPSDDARFAPGTTVTFNWTDVAGAESYTIQIDTSESFSVPLTGEATVDVSEYTAAGLPTTRMWWRARANQGGQWSSIRRFELKD